MNLRDFAQMLDGREYGYPQFTKEEITIAKENGFVIVTGASDDLVELEGAITDEGDCWEGGEICVHAVSGGRIVDSCTDSDTFCFDVKWCKDEDVNGEVIPWTYHVPVEHVHFMVYEDGKPYCRGFVFKVADAH